PYRGELVNPADMVAEGAPLRGQARAVALGEGGAGLANYGPVLRVTQPGGYTSLLGAEYMMLLTGSVDAGVVLDVTRGDAPILYLLGYGVLVDREQGRVVLVNPPPPGAWVARCVWPGTAADVRAPSFPREDCVALQTAARPERPVPAGKARVERERAGEVVIAADGPGWLVTTQPWYPGWSATVDGAAAVAEPVDGALVGVRLPTGAHTVVVRYWPAGLLPGVVLSLVAALLLVVVGRVRWRSGRTTAGAGRPGAPPPSATHEEANGRMAANP